MFTSFSATQVWMSGDKSVAKQPSKSERTLLDIRKESAAVRFDWVEGKNLLQSVLVPVSTNSRCCCCCCWWEIFTAAKLLPGWFCWWKTEISASLISVLWFYASLPDLASVWEVRWDQRQNWSFEFQKETPPFNPPRNDAENWKLWIIMGERPFLWRTYQHISSPRKIFPGTPSGKYTRCLA